MMTSNSLVIKLIVNFNRGIGMSFQGSNTEQTGKKSLRDILGDRYGTNCLCSEIMHSIFYLFDILGSKRSINNQKNCLQILNGIQDQFIKRSFNGKKLRQV